MAHMRMQRGAAAELLAANHLEVRGLKILGRNLRCKAGELDLVCLDGDVLAIVEVRRRDGSQFGGALASVTAAKQRKIIRAVKFFMQREPRWRDLPIRFDVLGVEGSPTGAYKIDWVKDAFRPG